MLTLATADAEALALWFTTLEIPVGRDWTVLTDAPSYTRVVGVATPVVEAGASHPNVICTLGPTSSGGVQVRAVVARSRVTTPATVRVKVMLGEAGNYPVVDDRNLSVPVGKVVFSRRDKQWRVHSTLIVDDVATSNNEWSEWTSTPAFQARLEEANVWGAYSTDSEWNSALVGCPFTPEVWRSVPPVFWASGNNPTDLVAPGWSRVGQSAGTRIYDTRYPYSLTSEMSVIWIDAPPGPILIGDTGYTLRGETRAGVSSANAAAPPGDYVFGNPARLIRRQEVWWPCFSQTEDGSNSVVLSPGASSTQDLGFVSLSTSPVPPVQPTVVSAPEASRFLAQATFGARMAEVERVQSMGFEAWLDEQATITAGGNQRGDAEVTDADGFSSVAYPLDEVHAFSRTKPYMDDLWLLWEAYIKKHWNPPAGSNGTKVDFLRRPADQGPFEYRFPYERQGGWHNPRGGNCATAWFRNVIRNDDQLRQRVAFALSQIFVVSATPESKMGMAMARYQDMLMGAAFGRFEDLLLKITYSPLMTLYLTYLGAVSGAADENYGRELLQLFTIGLVELNLDGTPRLYTEKTVNGEVVLEDFVPGVDDPAQAVTKETYTNDDIQELSRVFTGFSLEARSDTLSVQKEYISAVAVGNSNFMMGFTDVVLVPTDHDFGSKTFLGRTLPIMPDQHKEVAVRADVRAAIRVILEHRNVAPFFSKAMIRMLVKSNPSPAYVARVATVFNDASDAPDQMFQVVRAILLDPEARTLIESGGDVEVGKLQEPMVRLMRVVKALDGDMAVAPPRPMFTASNFLDPDEIDPDTIRAHSRPLWPKADAPSGQQQTSIQTFNGVTSGIEAFDLMESDVRFNWPFSLSSKAFGQWPYNSPSVFNFYDANYVHPSLTADADSAPGVASPEFGILHSASVVGFMNFLRDRMDKGMTITTNIESSSTRGPGAFEFSEPLEVLNTCQLAGTMEPLYDWLGLVIANGTLGTSSRAIVAQAIPAGWPSSMPADVNARTEVLKSVVWSAAIGPDGAVLR